MWHGDIKRPDPELVTIGKSPSSSEPSQSCLNGLPANDKLAFDVDLVVFVPKLAQQLERVPLEALRIQTRFV